MDKKNKLNRRDFIKNSAFSIGGLAITTSGIGTVSSLIQGCTTKSHFDTIIHNGLIYCGDGKEPRIGMIGIKDGIIKEIGNLGEIKNLAEQAKLIDANQMVISPGFIDIHTHTDANILQAPLGESRIYQGITTDIGGNCGDSPFPYHGEWEHIDNFYNAVSRVTPGINYKSFTGQGQIRSTVVGDNNTPATPQQISEMCQLLDKQMSLGSVGLTCGLEYAPGSYATDNEIVELCKVVASHNGLFAIHMRNEDDHVEQSIKEAIDIARKSKVRLQISHLKAQNAANWHKAANMIRLIEDAHKEGIDIAFDRYPYVAFSTGLTSFIPLNDRQGSNDDIIARLKDNKKAAEIGEYAVSRFKRLGGAKNVLIAACFNPNNQKFSGKNISECSKISGKSEWEITRELLITENLSVQIAGFAMTEDNVKFFLSHPLGMPSSDGSVYAPYGELGKEMPHPRSYGTFPRFFGKYIREEKICSLSEGIKKCTSLPAARLGLKNRGLIANGHSADIVIFNPDTIIDNASFDTPHQYPEGINHVIVNGVHTIKNGEFTGNKGGKIV